MTEYELYSKGKISTVVKGECCVTDKGAQQCRLVSGGGNSK